ncbi:Ail/Lom family outer membrane beta-barrel protein [Xenorhabdus japonica]|uniref:Putatice virulence related protein PagC n=1 Tax=Xenorhabdus japonica TaxID=53341 RepID=A0A1I5D3A3_9GAMM|nr:Ail/Lom family outer membrane beta-barrel protein [Xenorhabdus japonica]SFN93709.1 putatice virulence related protein PagC [Xenorhabdus japonica]
MVMKKSLLATLIVSGFMCGSVAYADSQTVAVGYAQSKIQDIKNLRGVNLHYRYEWDSPVSMIGSFTYMKSSESHSGYNDYGPWKANADLKYYSLMAGPAYRVNDYISVYGLLGFAHSKAELSGRATVYEDRKIMLYPVKLDNKSTELAYGAGVDVNPIPNLSLYAGYEGSSLKGSGDRLNINGFNIGVGYRF